VIEEICRMLPRLIGEDIELTFIPAPNLAKVKADPVQIEQVIMNLAANARDAMAHGGKLTLETANVRVDADYITGHPMVGPGDYVVVIVSDSGAGIAPEHLANIFEPFYTTKEEGLGTGLGLATVYGIIKQSGGFIWVYSELGLGTTFKIYLPQVESPVPATVVSAPVSLAPVTGTETLLLVEDEAAVRASTTEFLTMSGYHVLVAKNGEEALAMARDYLHEIHLLITDVIMPQIGGARLAEQMAIERPDTKVLFVSGYAENTLLRQGIFDVANRFLQKPFTLRSMASKVREILSSGITTPA
jgi:CheY-like chemotaxis protein